jgi:hypothetical protein
VDLKIIAKALLHRGAWKVACQSHNALVPHAAKKVIVLTLARPGRAPASAALKTSAAPCLHAAAIPATTTTARAATSVAITIKALATITAARRHP